MSRRISRLLCFTSTQKHSTWNTKWVRSEQYWCGGHSGRCWRSKFERKIGIVQTFWQKLKWRMENTEYSTLPCHPLTILCSTINWIKELECAAKINLAFGFVLKNIEDGMCRYFHAPENNTIMDRAKIVCTQADMSNLKDGKQKTDIVRICTRERANKKWKFYKLTKLTVFASLLKDVPMGCKDTILPEPLWRNCHVNCLIFERNTLQPYNDNLCLFKALALLLHGNKKLEEETSKNSKFFLDNS